MLSCCSHVLLCESTDCSLPGSSVHGDSPGKNIGVSTIPFSRESSQHGNQNQVSCIAGRFFTFWATREAHAIIEWVSVWRVLLFGFGIFIPYISPTESTISALYILSLFPVFPPLLSSQRNSFCNNVTAKNLKVSLPAKIHLLKFLFDLPNPGKESMSLMFPALASRFCTTSTVRFMMLG